MRIVYYVAVSADGFIATLDGGVDWLTPFHSSEEDYGYAEFFREVEALVMGRKTFEQLLGFGDWPYADKPCWILSSTITRAPDSLRTITSESPPALVRRLTQEGYQRVWIVGGATTAGLFEQHRLITDYVLTVIPVFLGQGISFFTCAVPNEALILTDKRTFGNVVQLSYVR